jgi:hypothetical protein
MTEGPLVIDQPDVLDDLDRVTAALSAAFVALRDAMQDERPVVCVVDERDLLGQRSVIDAALATGLVGLARTAALEGAKSGWSVNTVSHRGDPDSAAVRNAVAWLGGSGLSGQLLRVDGDHLGKVWP